MSVLERAWYLSVLGIIYTATNEIPFSATQFPTCLTALEDTNVSVYCSIPLFDNNPLVVFYWWRGDKDNALNLTAEERKLMFPFKHGSTEFQLLNLHFQDSRIYYCSIKVAGRKIFNGTGTRLNVHVADGSFLRMLQFPTRLTAVKGTNVSMNCTYTLFDPKAILDISWSKRNQNRTVEVTADNRKVMISLKQAAAELHRLNVDFQDSGVYYCSARDWKHKISSRNGSELIVHGTEITPVNAKDNSQFEEQRIQQGEMGLVSYALLNFREYKRSRKHRNEEDRTLYATV